MRICRFQPARDSTSCQVDESRYAYLRDIFAYSRRQLQNGRWMIHSVGLLSLSLSRCVIYYAKNSLQSGLCKCAENMHYVMNTIMKSFSNYLLMSW